MLDTTQILLLVLIIILSTVIVGVGVQFYFVLKELRKAVENTNEILEEFNTTAQNLSSSSQHIKDATDEVRRMAKNIQEGVSAPLVSGMATFSLIQKFIKPFFENNNDEEDEYYE